MESVAFKLSRQMIDRLEALARDEDVSLGQIIRAAIDRDLRRRDEQRFPERVEERLLAPIRARVTEDFLASGDWRALKRRLVDKGYALRQSGGGLALHDLVSGRFLCRTSELGFGYPALMKRFAEPFPGHSHTWVIDKLAEVPLYAKG